MGDIQVNLCEEILKEMKSLEFPEEFIGKFKSNELFIDAYSKHYGLQRTILTSLFFRILMSGNFMPPSEVRLALNSANDVVGWLGDIKVVILPFIKENLEKFRV